MPRSPRLRSALLACTLLLVPAASRPARAYSLLTHEQLIDLTWQQSIVPLLLSRYPTLTPAQLEHARAYAYGGCVIQDIGYYPFGDPFFSDLTHYVRSGDFVVNLFRNAGNPDELAFAVGALSHYIGDTVGHAEATNLAVPVEFPKLRRRYGNSVSYAEGEHQHVQTEFAFDIAEISHHHLAPVHYLRHVGLELPSRQLALAFYQTYGLQQDITVGRKRRINAAGYRFAVHHFIPRIAYAVNLLHRHGEPPEPTGDPAVTELATKIATVAQQNNWDSFRRSPGLGTWSLAGLLFIFPKFGPLKLVSIKGPTPQTESEYLHSVLRSTVELNHALHRFTPPPATRPSAVLAAKSNQHQDPAATSNTAPAVDLSSRPEQSGAERPAVALSTGTTGTRPDPNHPLPNRDLDTGNPTAPGGYPLTDQTYARLLHFLASHPTSPIPVGIRDDITGFYSNPTSTISTKQNPAAWAVVQHDLQTLQTIPTSPYPTPVPTYDDDPAPTGS